MPDPAGTIPAAGGLTATARILVADDEPAILRALSIRLGLGGFEVTEAHNGETALRSAREQPPDLAIVDRRMPDIAGDDVARRLRRDIGPADLPVIVITANPIGLDPDIGIGPPLVILHKPYEPSELLRVVHEQLHGRDAPPPGA